MRDGRSLAYIAGFAILGVLLTQVSYLSAIAYTNAGTGTVLERTGLVLIMGYVPPMAMASPVTMKLPHFARGLPGISV